MPDPRDLLRGVGDLVSQMREAAESSASAPLAAALQAQAELLEQATRRQLEFERRISGALGPMTDIVDVVAEVPAAMRSQARAFEAASAAFKQSADLLNLQAELLERAGAALNAPRHLLEGLHGED